MIISVVIKIGSSYYYESVVVVPKELIIEFCQNYEEYVFPTMEQLWFGIFVYVLQDQEEKILEAAHVVGVTQDGKDNADNGLCLCRNYHKLYDSGLLNIDIIENRFQCYSKNEKQMHWYRETEQRNFKCIY